MTRGDAAGALLEKAGEDVHVLVVLRKDSGTTDAIWGFHAQQAVEKLIKALLTDQGESFLFTHRLLELADLVKSWQTRFVQFEPLLDLTPYAVEYRYSMLPGKIAEPPMDRDSLLGLIQEFHAIVRSEITQ